MLANVLNHAMCSWRITGCLNSPLF